MKQHILIFFTILVFVSCKSEKKDSTNDAASGATEIVNKIHYPQEKHLKNIKQLTFGGDNAEAYWSFDGSKLVFQSNNKKWGLECDQIFTMSATKALDSTEVPQLVSTGFGRTTCSYFYQAILPLFIHQLI